MKKNEIQSFSIDYEKHTNCQLVDKDKKQVTEYHIKKTKQGEEWHFTASTDTDFKEEEQPTWYLGASQCHDAFIDWVKVSSSDGNTNTNVLNAQRCGIGTILSALCMIDKDVMGSGIALDLKRHFGRGGLNYDQISKLIQEVKKDCKKVVGLQMSAAQGGGNTYFSAARLAGFHKMIFYDGYEKNEWIWPEIPEAQTCYNENKLGCQGAYWYFCKERSTTDNPRPVPSCFRKMVPTCLKPNN